MKKIAPFLLGLPLGFQLFACSTSNLKTDHSVFNMLANPPTVLGDGVAKSTLTITAIAADGVSPYTGTANMSSTVPLKFGTSQSNSETLTITNGAATETVSCDGVSSMGSPLCFGQAVIYGYLESNGAGQAGQVTVTFDAPDAGPVDAGVDAGPKDAGPSDAGPDSGVFVPNAIISTAVQPAFLGVDYQASYNVNPIGTFSFKVINTNADAGVGQIPVTFGLQTQTTAKLLTGSPVLSDSMGNVQAQVQSGSAGSVVVTATATLPADGGLPDGGQAVSAQASVTVIGTQPSWGNSSISCTPQNLPVFAHGNLPCGQSSTQNLQTTCTARLGDRFGNSIGIAVPVVFYSEAGTWVNSQISTPAYGLPNAGLATAFLQTNKPLPQDVDPVGSEPSYQDTCGGLPHTYNPRDGVVTVIAVFRGEEAFVVPPTTGVWAPGVEFTDLPQPFVDNDDSSVFKGNDVCPGNGGTGTCALPNGTWDSNSSIFVETRVIYTGSSNYTAVGSEPSTPTISATGPIVVPAGGQYRGTVTFGDLNLNIYNPAGTQKVSLTTGPTTVTVGGALSQGVNVTDQLGMHYLQLAQCNSGTTSEDGGAAVPTQICTLQTVINSFLGGYPGPYTLATTAAVSDGGGIPICITAQGTVPPDLGVLYDFCGVAY